MRRGERGRGERGWRFFSHPQCFPLSTPPSAPFSLAVYKAFKEGQKRILVATDLVGRGIDVEARRGGGGGGAENKKRDGSAGRAPTLTPPPPPSPQRVNIVINYDMPETDAAKGNGADTYLHRVGRAGRFGTKGLAVTFVSSEADSGVLNQVQERFDVDIKPLPDQVDAASYMTTA